MSDVILSIHPSVSGMRWTGMYGPIDLESRLIGASWEEGIEAILDEAAGRARACGANAVVGLEIECDPYHRDGGHVSIQGTIALLEPRFLEMAP